MKDIISILILSILVILVIYLLFNFIKKHNHCHNCGHVKSEVYKISQTPKSKYYYTEDYYLCDKCYKNKKYKN